MKDENELAIADLKFLLPLQPGEHIWLGGNYPRLITELQKQQMDVTLYDAETHVPNPHDPAEKFNHAIFPAMPFAEIELNFKLWSAYLMDGASLVFGSSNPAYWLRFVKPSDAKNTIGLDPKNGKIAAGKYSFTIEHLYGNPGDADTPRYLVELDRRPPSTYYFKELFTPYRRGSKMVRQLTLGWGRVNPAASLYRSLVWHATYHQQPGGVHVE